MEIQKFDVNNPKSWFDWFTTEVIKNRDIYSNDTLSTATVNSKIFELSKELKSNYISTPFDAVIWHGKDGGRDFVLTMEHENRPGWKDIKEDFVKLLCSKSRLKLGIFYIHKRRRVDAEEELTFLLEKMLGMITNTTPKQDSKEIWLVIIGVRIDEINEITFRGFTVVDDQFKEIGKVNLE